MHLIILDNYDSFTYNLSHILATLCDEVTVVRNDQVGLDFFAGADGIVLSPGPGLPSEAGILMDTIRTYHSSKPLLGVCLGHQAIVEFFGGRLINLDTCLHGVSTITTRLQSAEPLYSGLPDNFLTGHYHSWSADPSAIPEELEVTAENEYGMVMSVRHRTLPICSVQFHPESVLTPLGPQMLANWVKGIQKG
jgi:anthranilate synthase component II